jgi:hypothetical protein
VSAGWQATVVAVNAANADVTIAAQAMAVRMHETAANLITAGRHYTATDKQAAVGLRAPVTEV